MGPELLILGHCSGHLTSAHPLTIRVHGIIGAAEEITEAGTNSRPAAVWGDEPCAPTLDRQRRGGEPLSVDLCCQGPLLICRQGNTPCSAAGAAPPLTADGATEPHTTAVPPCAAACDEPGHGSLL